MYPRFISLFEIAQYWLPLLYFFKEHFHKGQSDALVTCMTDVLLLTNHRTAASQAPPIPAVEQKPRRGIKGERRGGTARSRVQLFLGARGLFVWRLHVLPVPMWDSKLTLGACGCLFLYVRPMMSPLTTESGTQES